MRIDSLLNSLSLVPVALMDNGFQTLCLLLLLMCYFCFGGVFLGVLLEFFFSFSF